MTNSARKLSADITAIRAHYARMTVLILTVGALLAVGILAASAAGLTLGDLGWFVINGIRTAWDALISVTQSVWDAVYSHFAGA